MNALALYRYIVGSLISNFVCLLCMCSSNTSGFLDVLDVIFWDILLIGLSMSHTKRFIWRKICWSSNVQVIYCTLNCWVLNVYLSCTLYCWVLSVFLEIYVWVSQWPHCCLSANLIQCNSVYSLYKHLDDPVFVFAQP